ncbi:MAG: hypothetical protein INR62_06270 [Rhodospirillales bacterium]|nr:hypothetical protein [Acetobacter sp.]
MNGRALNDRAIEVAPSSSRVLDRAAGSQPPGGPPLLTPFPPSKNRPRPGDWTCPSCGFSNFQRRTACFRCSFPGMSILPSTASSSTRRAEWRAFATRRSRKLARSPHCIISGTRQAPGRARTPQSRASRPSMYS